MSGVPKRARTKLVTCATCLGVFQRPHRECPFCGPEARAFDTNPFLQFWGADSPQRFAQWWRSVPAMLRDVSETVMMEDVYTGVLINRLRSHQPDPFTVGARIRAVSVSRSIVRRAMISGVK